VLYLWLRENCASVDGNICWVKLTKFF